MCTAVRACKRCETEKEINNLPCPPIYICAAGPLISFTSPSFLLPLFYRLPIHLRHARLDVYPRALTNRSRREKLSVSLVFFFLFSTCVFIAELCKFCSADFSKNKTLVLSVDHQSFFFFFFLRFYENVGTKDQTFSPPPPVQLNGFAKFRLRIIHPLF